MQLWYTYTFCLERWFHNHQPAIKNIKISAGRVAVTKRISNKISM